MLCRDPPETRVHLIATCSALSRIRSNLFTECPVILDPKNAEETACLVLGDPGKIPCDIRDEVELWSRHYCYALHNKRSKIITGLPI